MTKATVSKLFAMLLSVGLVAGCATTSDIERLQDQINKAQQTADNAMTAANAADSKAMAADNRAQSAMNAANAAQNAADDCSERCERMMGKAMAK